jgi:hypothetical protein
MNNKLKVHPSKYNQFGDTIDNDGMDLRDYFANSAMIGLLSTNATYGGKTDNREALAKDAYLTADAMLKQREL